ncbi:MAG TPA: hypothetical protein VGV13_07310 [Methylomirabilota bacterium]|nr:hypothetical protein [Methylomirabilota bacterium]
MRLRRYYYHHVKPHQRFHIAVFLTIIAVAWIAVPGVARFVETIGSYNPAGYEPKDGERAEWLAKRDPNPFGYLTWENLLKIALFIFVGLAWLAVAPTLQRPGRSLRR